MDGMLMFVVIAVFIALSLAGGKTVHSKWTKLRETPEEILKKRYARGEIDHEHYVKQLEELRR